MDILSPATTDHSQTPPLFRRPVTVPTASSVSPRSSPSIREAVEEEAETLYAHHAGKIVSFNPPISGTRRHSSVEQGYSALDDEPVGTLPWASATERTLAAGPLRIYRVLGSVAFLNSGNSLLKPILAKSQCWCVDGESKFVLHAGRHTYYRIELPNSNADDRTKVDEFKSTLGKVLQYETTPCPFKRGFTVDLPEKPKTPVRKKPWQPQERPQPAAAAERSHRAGRGLRRWQRSTIPVNQPHAADLFMKEDEDTVAEYTDSVPEDSAEGERTDDLEMTPRDPTLHAREEFDPYKTPTRPRTLETGRATTAPPPLLLHTSFSDRASEDNDKPDVPADALDETLSLSSSIDSFHSFHSPISPLPPSPRFSPRTSSPDPVDDEGITVPRARNHRRDDSELTVTAEAEDAWTELEPGVLQDTTVTFSTALPSKSLLTIFAAVEASFDNVAEDLFDAACSSSVIDRFDVEHCFQDHECECILEHVYRSRPPTPRTLLPLYQRHPKPRPSVINLPDINPPTVLFSLVHSNLLFLSTASTDVEPLFILEFLHRIIDVFEEFIGGPLLASRIESSYDVVAQLLGEMCDAGSVCNTEPNALRDDVDIPGWMDKFLGGVGLPGSPGSLPSGGLKHQLKLTPISNGPAIPWRRANVRHTSNELYVDILETLHITLAPSGRPLAAIANGSIAFTSKISGVPDLLLTLSASGGKLGLEKAIELPVFHPCVRLARWKERPGELSFVPPDGKFMLAGYEVNLMPSIHDLKSWYNVNLQLPVSVEVSKSLGPAGTDFEVRLAIYNTFPGVASAASAPRPALGSRGSGVSTPVFGGGTSTSPTLQDLVVTIPIPNAVRSVIDLRASRGEAYFTASESVVEWRISTKAAASPGTATLRCTVVGPLAETDAEDMANGFHSDPGAGDYDEDRDAYQSSSDEPAKKPSTREQLDSQDARRVQQNLSLMPASASVSFSVKGWLASGIKVDGLNIDTRKSRGLGEGVKPYKGVKYLTVSRNGIETRC
ncbi:MAG: hypothetical protein Q9210_003742 [Variospora velana]